MLADRVFMAFLRLSVSTSPPALGDRHDMSSGAPAGTSSVAHPSIASNDPENHLDFLNDQDHADEQAGRDPR